MPNPARIISVRPNWEKYERKASVRLRSRSSNKKTKISSRHSRSPIALGLAALFFLIALILVGKLFGFIGSINQPYSKDSQKVSTWDGNSPLNLVIKMDNIYLLSYQPSSKELTTFIFPQDIYIDTLYGFGKWPLRSIYDLGQVEKPSIGSKLLKDSIGNAFNIIIDGYIITADNSTNFSNLLARERGSFIPGIDLLSKAKTDLNLPEFFRVWLAIKGVRTDKLKTIDLEKSDLTKWLLLPDGSRVLALDQVKLDQFTEGRFEDINIKNEGLSIGIFNATDHPGLAEKYAQIITNLGGRVIFTTNAPEKEAYSIILGKKSYTTSYFSKVIQLSSTQPKNNLDLSKSDITIILGEDSTFKYK